MLSLRMLIIRCNDREHTRNSWRCCYTVKTVLCPYPETISSLTYKQSRLIGQILSAMNRLHVNSLLLYPVQTVIGSVFCSARDDVRVCVEDVIFLKSRLCTHTSRIINQLISIALMSNTRHINYDRRLTGELKNYKVWKNNIHVWVRQIRDAHSRVTSTRDNVLGLNGVGKKTRSYASKKCIELLCYYISRYNSQVVGGVEDTAVPRRGSERRRG